MKVDASTRQPPTRLRLFGQGFALFALVVFAYVPAVQCGFIWDDDDYVTQNAVLRSANGLWRIWFEPRATPQYYPLVHTTFWIEYHLWGLAPAGYHLVNVLLHAGNALLVWLVLRRLGIPGAWIAAAIFGLHPVHVESVAWVTERKNVLSGLFYLGALLTYTDVAALTSTGGQSSRRKYAYATLLFVAALLSKSVTCSLPAVILLLILWKRRRLTWVDVQPLVPWFVLGLGVALTTATLETSHVGAGGAPFDWTLAERCLIASRALSFYAGKLVWPHTLSFMYPRWTINTGDPWQWGFVGLVLAWLALMTVLRNQWGWGPLTATLYFAGTLFPALGFFNVYPMRYSFVADHFQYLASLGPITLAAAGFARFINHSWTVHRAAESTRHPAGRKRRQAARGVHPQIGAGLTALALGILAPATWSQQRIYRNPESLWTDVLAKNPRSGIAHFHLGKIRMAQGNAAAAIEHFREALIRQTDDTEVHIIQTLLANCLVREGDVVEAQASFEQALDHDPNFWEALNGLGNLLARQGQVGPAIELYRRALAVAPDQAAVHHNLANALAVSGDLAESERHYRESIRLDPQAATTYLNLGNLLARQKRFGEAEQQYTSALNCDGSLDAARLNLSRVRAAQELR
jgi:tetratricopeptide (TPR) repeat protein